LLERDLADAERGEQREQASSDENIPLHLSLLLSEKDVECGRKYTISVMC
jgi:hypothetical protein